jgi:hypothetical protein
MSRIEETLLRRYSGARIVAFSVLLAMVGWLPLLLYTIFGPEDGNPIGLGLLAMAVTPFAGVGLAVGVIRMVVEWFSRRAR